MANIDRHWRRFPVTEVWSLPRKLSCELCRDLLRCQCDGAAQTFQPMNRVAREVVLLSLSRLKIPRWL